MKIEDIANVTRGLEMLRHGATMGRDGFNKTYQDKLMRQYEKSKKSLQELCRGIEGA